jgi:hypothetical protein
MALFCSHGLVCYATTLSEETDVQRILHGLIWRLTFLAAIVGLLAPESATRPIRHEFSEIVVDVDMVGDPSWPGRTHAKTAFDTVWIVDWTFDAAGPCDDSGWQAIDNRILNDGAVHWRVESDFAGTGNIVGNGAVVGYQDNLCCEEPGGYDNNWYQAIRIQYEGAGVLSFDYVVDSEVGFDFMNVEEDSACASFSRVDYLQEPSSNAALFRRLVHSESGFNDSGMIVDLQLTDFGAPSCTYIAFFSDGGWSPCDGLQPTVIGAGLVIDNIVVVDQAGVRRRTENFDDGSLDLGAFVNIQDSAPFGNWARTFPHITDNDVCQENSTCALLWTDYTTPTIANDPSMSFGPGGFVIRNWLENSIVSPWVSLSTTPDATSTFIEYRRFPGNLFRQSRIVQNWSVRGKRTIDGQTCISSWGHASRWNSLSFFGWLTMLAEMTADFDPASEEIQIRHRTSDWQWIAGADPPEPFIPGPGPYVDRTRIGRLLLSGPVIDEGIDARRFFNDTATTEIYTGVTPGTGERFRPTTDRFGSVAFSTGTDLGRGNTSPNLLTGDSITVFVTDVRGAGGVTSVELHGAIVSGPHAGKAPPPWTVGGNGFFTIAADSVRNASGSVTDERWFIDIDDYYLLGGDILHYFWSATDAQGGFTSDPIGLTAIPSSIGEAQEATQGMFEMSALPTINWNQNLLDDIAGDPNGKIDPHVNPDRYITGSTQAKCILYVNRINSRRRSGDVSRTSFMYSLDQLGYRGHYDVYDHQGMGNTNNHLGGRATVQQAQRYNLIIYDAGNTSPAGTIMPDGSDLDAARVDQHTWFTDWLRQASTTTTGPASLWILGSNVVEEHPNSLLYTSDMGVSMVTSSQSAGLLPEVEGSASFQFDTGSGSVVRDFSNERFRLQSGCPVYRNYDGLEGVGPAVETHMYKDSGDGTIAEAAIVMNSNPSENWNTIMQSHPWFDIRNDEGPAPSPEIALLNKILTATLPLECQASPNPTDVPDITPVVQAPPLRTTLHPPAPNPFNAVTTFRFDLADEGHVVLRIYDVSGRRVRTLLNGFRTRDRHSVIWDGLDDTGTPAASGVYYAHFVAPRISKTRTLVILK